MDDHNLAEKIYNIISEIMERETEMIQRMSETIVESLIAMVQIALEVSEEMGATNAEYIKKLVDAIDNTLIDSYIFNERYGRKVKRYQQYKKPLKRFIDNHPVFAGVLIGVLTEILVGGINCVGNMIINKTEEKNSVNYELQYNSNDEIIDISIDAKSIGTEEEIYLPDGTKMRFIMP